jgi:hypothetical protein
MLEEGTRVPVTNDLTACRLRCSPRQPEHQKERASQSFARVWIERSYDPLDPIVAERVELVGHDLRANEQTVLDSRSDDGPHFSG